MMKKNFFQDHNKLICPLSEDKNFKLVFSIKRFPIYMGTVRKNHNIKKKNMNFYINKKTGSVQIYPRVELSKLYFKSHGSGKIGETWQQHHQAFFNFIKLKSNQNILEIGGGHNSISLKSNKKINLTSFEPNVNNMSSKKKRVIKEFFSSNSLKKHNLFHKFDVVVHSHLFEHIYEPKNFLKAVHKSLKTKGKHIFSVPNMDMMIKNNISSSMNFEHPYFLNKNIIKDLLSETGFKIIEKKYFKNSHSIFYKTIKLQEKNNLKKKNFYKKNLKLFKNLNKNWKRDVESLNKSLNKKKNNYLFGAHIFSQNLIQYGLKINNISGILDNDTEKQNEYLYGTKIKVFCPKILREKTDPVVILRAGTYNSEIKKQLISINKSVKFL